VRQIQSQDHVKTDGLFCQSTMSRSPSDVHDQMSSFAWPVTGLSLCGGHSGERKSLSPVKRVEGKSGPTF
jgi:hypothetical protein